MQVQVFILAAMLAVSTPLAQRPISSNAFKKEQPIQTAVESNGQVIDAKFAEHIIDLAIYQLSECASQIAVFQNKTAAFRIAADKLAKNPSNIARVAEAKALVTEAEPDGELLTQCENDETKILIRTADDVLRRFVFDRPDIQAKLAEVQEAQDQITKAKLNILAERSAIQKVLYELEEEAED